MLENSVLSSRPQTEISSWSSRPGTASASGMRRSAVSDMSSPSSRFQLGEEDEEEEDETGVGLAGAAPAATRHGRSSGSSAGAGTEYQNVYADGRLRSRPDLGLSPVPASPDETSLSGGPMVAPGPTMSSLASMATSPGRLEAGPRDPAPALLSGAVPAPAPVPGPTMGDLVQQAADASTSTTSAPARTSFLLGVEEEDEEEEDEEDGAAAAAAATADASLVSSGEYMSVLASPVLPSSPLVEDGDAHGDDTLNRTFTESSV